MNVKTFLRGFWQTISVAKFFIFQTLSLFFVSYAVGMIAEAMGSRGCPPRPEFMGAMFYGIIIFAAVLAILSLHPIVMPGVWLQEISRDITRSKIDLRFRFFSTHPSYVLLDALLFIPALLLFWNGGTETMCEFNLEWGQGIAALVIAIAYPTLRLIFWYVLGRQIYAIEGNSVWLAITWWYILTLPVIVVFSSLYVESYIEPRRGLPVVNSETFVGGIDAQPQFRVGIVRIRGTIKQGIAKCGLWGKKDRTDYPFGTVVLDMGPGNGEVIVQVKRPGQVLDLEAESKRQGEFETFGRLSKLPNPEKKMLCAISNLPDDPPPGGRALLEVEIPK
jgi:hypothetical protein